MQYINIFLQDLKNKNYSKNTLHYYNYILFSFAKYLDSISIFEEKDVTEKHFKDYIQRYKNNNYHSTYYTIIIITKKYFSFLTEHNYIFFSPIGKIKNPKQVLKHHPIINKNELKNIFDNYNSDKPFDIRTRAILELLYSSALRPSESLNLKISDINYDSRIILIRKTKTKTDRIVPVTKEALYWIDKYISKVRLHAKYNKSPDKLFISFKIGKQLTLTGLRCSLRKSLAKKGIKQFALYSLRASSATHLFENGMSINHLQLLLGHTSLVATCIYVRVSFLNLKETLKLSHPRLKLEDLKQERSNENELSNAS